VLQLEAAGYVNVGKTNLHEFAYGITSENPHFGDVVNPFAPGRIPGGSSGGSAAALAAGLCEAALGTDSAGSIRIPAACCGIVGFKPSHGLVSTDGVWPLARSFDCAGPMARSVEGCRAMMMALAGLRSASLELGDLRVGVAWLGRAQPLVRARVDAAASLFGARVDLDPPLLTRETYPVFMREAAEVHRELFARHGGLYGADVRLKIERCLRVGDAEFGTALAALDRYREAFAAEVEGVDLLVSPTIPSVAPPTGIGDLALRDELISLTYPLSALGWPALALPCGAAEHGLPASIQLAAARGRDDIVLAAGLELEAALTAMP
jgi:aspartyl-tRNA(Asn)/glutamyl-tRNA(Gln) amidotransferase subunit A